MGASAGFSIVPEVTCVQAIDIIFACAGRHDVHRGEDPLDPRLCEELNRVHGHVFGPDEEVRCATCFSHLLNLGMRFNSGTI
jgi:hypothetical protein